MSMLSSIHNPEDIRSLTYPECEELAEEIRQEIIRVVAEKGGHLSSNLGMVETTIALHRCFDTPHDKLIFDVGHQTYTHKLLTGRYERFPTLRSHGGLCGFPRKAESEYDVFEAGHASTSVSAAVGMARARDIAGEKHHVVAVIGDGATTGGLYYEALNDCGSRKTRLIVVLNDNEMSIAKNVGALSKYFSHLRASRGYIVTKKQLKTVFSKIPVIGDLLYQVFHYAKTFFKRVFIGEGFFSTLGFHYLGPVDGHNLKKLEKAFAKAKQLDEPVIVHVLTTKGRGYPEAEEQPEKYHGVNPFHLEEGETVPNPTFSCGEAVNRRLINRAKLDNRICVVTAAMPLGTATGLFYKQYSNRFFDAGIAEEHAVTMCAGLANGGMLPVLFVYSTFLQRGYDQILHDVCMQQLHVVLMLDRSGFAGEDGKTHHGIYDFAYLRHIPGIKLLAPCSIKELTDMTDAALAADGPVAIRYPKTLPAEPELPARFEIGKWQVLREGSDAVLLAVGSMVSEALKLVAELSQYSLGVINASTVKPLDEAMLTKLARQKLPVFTLEEHARLCGFGSSVLEWAEQHEASMPIHCYGVEDEWIQHGTHAELMEDAHLDAASLQKRILESLRKIR